ncbi:MAG: glycosyltransferase family 2 protein [Caldimonas sp.]
MPTIACSQRDGLPIATLSVTLITKNESANIDACLASVAFADEWIVVDASSSDDTAERARRFGARVVVSDDWPGFGLQKQRALDAATGDWVLSLDADERVTPELAASIRAVVAGRDGAGADTRAYALSRVSQFAGRWIRHGDWYPDRVMRLVRRGAARFSADLVHERLIATGRVGRLEGELLHYTMPTYADALDKMNRYSSGRAADRVASGQRGGLGAALSHGAWAFARSYVLRRGFLDGAAGFAVAAYIAEGTWWRYLKMAELARRLPGSLPNGPEQR